MFDAPISTWLAVLLLLPKTFVIGRANLFMYVFCFWLLQVRVLVSDFAVCIAILLMVVADLLIGLGTPKLEVPPEFRVSGILYIACNHSCRARHHLILH